jgi:hypothetical protein
MKKLKYIKYRFLIFLKQFKVDEIKLLMNFLQLVVHEYNNNSLKLFDLLNTEDDDIVKKMPKILKVESLSTIIDSTTTTTTTTKTKHDSVYFSKKTSRTPSAFNLLKSKVNNDEELNGRDDDERAAINALTRLSDSYPNNDINNDSSSQDSNQIIKSNFSRISSICVNHLLINDSECDDDDDDDDDEYESDYVTGGTTTEDWSNYGILSTMTDDDIDDEDTGAACNDGTFNTYDYDSYNNTMNSNYDEIDEYNGDLNSNNKKKRVATENLRNSNGRIRKFSDHIRTELEKHFQKNRYISGDEKKMLADKLSLTVRQVQKWFVHRREKFRRYEKHHGKKTLVVHKQHQQQQPENDEYHHQMFIKEEKFDYDDEDEEDDDEEMSESMINEQQGAKKYTPYIENYLEKLFRKKSQFTQRDLNSACLNLNLKPKQVRIWLQNRRQKEQKLGVGGGNKNTNGAAGVSKKKVTYDGDLDVEENLDLDLNKRQNYPENVLRQLENAFLRNRYISGNDKRILSKKLGLAPIQIERWFYTRRKKCNIGNS